MNVPQELGKTVVAIGGMHRSGTSALAGALSVVGGVTPAELMAADRYNAKGYFEPREAVAAADLFLARFGRTWRDFRAFPAAFLDEGADLEEVFLDLLLRGYAGSGPKVLKDPRLVLFLPLWDRAIARAGLEAAWVIPLRAPRAVAASLLRRDGMTPLDADALWLRHMIDAERGTRGRRRAILPTSRLLDDPAGALVHLGDRLGLAWPRPPRDAAADLRAFVETGLMEETAAPASPLSDLARTAHRALLALAEAPEDPAALAALDETAAAFDSIAVALTHLLVLPPMSGAQAEVLDRAERRVAEGLRRGEPGAAAALSALRPLPRAMAEAKLAALADDVDDLVRELAEARARPFRSGLRLLGHAVLDHAERLAPVLSPRRLSRMRRSREKRDPVLPLREWANTRPRLLAAPAPAEESEWPTGAAPVAVCIHAFYPDVLDEILLRFREVPREALAFYLTCPQGTGRATRLICAAHGVEAEVREVENRGRDVLPFLGMAPRILDAGHPAVLKLHTKKSLHQSGGRAWRAALLGDLVRPGTIRRAAEAMRADPSIGIVAPHAHVLDLEAFLDSNRPRLCALLDAAGLPHAALTGGFFVAGTMMYLRTSLAAELAKIVDPADFEPEAGQTEGTLAHAVERFIATLARGRGHSVLTTDLEVVRQGRLQYEHVGGALAFRHVRDAGLDLG